MNQKRIKYELDYLQVPTYQQRATSSHELSNNQKDKKEYYLGHQKSKVFEKPKFSLSDSQNLNILLNASDASQTMKRKTSFQKVSIKEEVKDSYPIHRKIISEKLTKQSQQNRPPIINIIGDPDNGQDSSPDHDIWGNLNQPQVDEFFQLYHFRSNQISPQNNLTDNQVVRNIKQLLGQNLKVRGLGQYPWFTYKTQSNKVQTPRQITPTPSVQNFLDYLQKKYNQKESKSILKIKEVDQKNVVLKEMTTNRSRLLSGRVRLQYKLNASQIDSKQIIGPSQKIISDIQPIKKESSHRFQASSPDIILNKYYLQKIVENQKIR